MVGRGSNLRVMNDLIGGVDVHDNTKLCRVAIGPL